LASLTDEVRQAVDRVAQTVAGPELNNPRQEAQRRQEFRKTVDGMVDFAEMAKRSLATHWKKQTPEERQEFVSLFQTLLEKTYAARIASQKSDGIVYQKELLDDPYAEVRSKVLAEKGAEHSLDYRLIRKQDRWLVYDVVVDGVSLVSNYRGQFNRIVRSQGYPELVRKLRAGSEEIKSP